MSTLMIPKLMSLSFLYTEVDIPQVLSCIIPSTWINFIADLDLKLKSVEALWTLCQLLLEISLKSLEYFHNLCWQ